VFVAAAALRGYVPGAEPRPREESADSPVAVAVVVALLAASVAVVAIAVIARLRNRGATAPRVTGRSDWLRGDRTRPTWRMALVAFGLILGWLLLFVVLGRLFPGRGADGVSAAPGSRPDTSQTAAEPDRPADLAAREPDTGADLLAYFYGATAVFVFVLVAGSVVAARRQRRLGAPVPPVPSADETAAESASGSESLARAAEVGLAEVGDLSREPRKAIIACYAAMERQLSLVPDAAPRDFDTASEVLARAVDHHALAPDSATQLVDLFDEARFSSHVMDEGHRDAAVAVLTQVLDELRSHT
jgi:hypothetical protein